MQHKSVRDITAHSVRQTREEGARCARETQAGAFYALIGELGSGKTEFVRGFVAALNPDSVVHSPTFSLLNIYDTHAFPVYHFDFYRLCDEQELIETGFDEFVGGDGVCLVEWADMFPDAWPAQQVSVVRFTDAGDGTRKIVRTVGSHSVHDYFQQTGGYKRKIGNQEDGNQ
jgi:tRNA threonylcarbamoyladenosine biosynthesis protein TsaE